MQNRPVLCSLVVAGVLLAAGPARLNAADAPAQRDATSVINGIRLKKMTQDLTLTDDQQKKIKAILDDEGRKVKAIQDNEALPHEEKFGKVNAIKADSQKQMAEVLTPEQRKKWDEQRAATGKKKKPAAKP